MLLIHLVALAKGGDILLANFTKPLLLFGLAVYFHHAKKNKTKEDKLFFVGLCLSWLGDVLLMLAPKLPEMFLAGLGSFLFAHVFYILSFYKKEGLVKSHPWLVIFPIAMGWGVVQLFFPHLGGLAFPVLLYIVVISIMLLAAINRGFSWGQLSFYLIVSGAFLFVLSDFILAYNKFVAPLPWSGVWIMLTYGMAQYALVRGMLSQKV